MATWITKAWRHLTVLASTALIASVSAIAPAYAGPGPMQVEEPAVRGAQPPIQPEKEQASWKARKKAGLTPDQQASLKARQQTMKDMMVLIQQKRRALQEARPEDRQALAAELHGLIIEKGLASDRVNRAPVRTDGKREGGLEKQGGSDAMDQEKAARVREERPAAVEPKPRVREERRRTHEDRSWNWED